MFITVPPHLICINNLHDTLLEELGVHLAGDGRCLFHQAKLSIFLYRHRVRDHSADVHLHTEHNTRPNCKTKTKKRDRVILFRNKVRGLNPHFDLRLTFTSPSAVIMSFQLFMYSPGNLSLLKTPTVLPSLLPLIASTILSKLALLLSF